MSEAQGVYRHPGPGECGIGGQWAVGSVLASTNTRRYSQLRLCRVHLQDFEDWNWHLVLHIGAARLNVPNLVWEVAEFDDKLEREALREASG